MTVPGAVGQKLLGPERICPAIVLLADVPEDVALFNSIRDALRVYPQDRANYMAGETAQSIDGYYPLYTTEAAANDAGDGSSHTHTFDGVTYYMPNGVTYYHGNYNEPADTTDSGSTDTTDSDDSGSTDSGSSSSGGSYGY